MCDQLSSILSATCKTVSQAISNVYNKAWRPSFDKGSSNHRMSNQEPRPLWISSEAMSSRLP